jgi:hypothetical protein
MDLAYFDSVQLPHDVRDLENISYGFDRSISSDGYCLSRRISKNRYPLIIQVHGGGWVYGSKDTIYKAYGMALAQKGFAVITLIITGWHQPTVSQISYMTSICFYSLSNSMRNSMHSMLNKCLWSEILPVLI